MRYKTDITAALGSSAHEFYIDGNATPALKLDSSQNATFTGNVDANSITVGGASVVPIIASSETAGYTAGVFRHNAVSGNYGLTVDFTAASPNNRTNYFLRFDDSSVNGKTTFWSDGGATFTGDVMVPVGSVTSPSLTFTGDTDTGIYRRTANTINIATGGVQRLEIDSAGNAIFAGDVTVDTGANAASITINSPSQVWSGGENLGELNWYTEDTSGAGPANVAGIKVTSAGANTLPVTSMVFQTSNANATPATALTLNGAQDATFEGDVTVNGSVTATGNITAYSDRKLKDNLEVIPNALDKVSQLTGYTYDRIDMDGVRQSGLIAQDVQEVLPEVIVNNVDPDSGEETLSVAYGNMIGLLVEAVKELKAEVEELKGK
jgi:hypothetical protein